MCQWSVQSCHRDKQLRHHMGKAKCWWPSLSVCAPHSHLHPVMFFPTFSCGCWSWCSNVPVVNWLPQCRDIPYEAVKVGKNHSTFTFTGTKTWQIRHLGGEGIAFGKSKIGWLLVFPFKVLVNNVFLMNGIMMERWDIFFLMVNTGLSAWVHTVRLLLGLTKACASEATMGSPQPHRPAWWCVFPPVLWWDASGSRAA